MKISVKLFRERVQINVKGDTRDEHVLEVSCIPAGKQEPLEIQVRSDRELCDMRSPVNELVNKYVDRALKSDWRDHASFDGTKLNAAFADERPLRNVETSTEPASPYPTPVMGLGAIVDRR